MPVNGAKSYLKRLAKQRDDRHYVKTRPLSGEQRTHSPAGSRWRGFLLTSGRVMGHAGFMKWLLVIMLLIIPMTAYAHGGGLDSLGCHHNRKQGGYHCHRGELVGQSFSSKQDALDALSEASVESVEPPQSQPRQCCKVCKKGKPCGNSCISRSKTCHQPPGCAC